MMRFYIIDDALTIPVVVNWLEAKHLNQFHVRSLLII